MSRHSEYSQLDQDLESFGEVWEISHSIITCQDCGASQAVDHAGEPVVHASDCQYSSRKEQHPWHELAGLLRNLPPMR